MIERAVDHSLSGCFIVKIELHILEVLHSLEDPMQVSLDNKCKRKPHEAHQQTPGNLEDEDYVWAANKIEGHASQVEKLLTPDATLFK